MIQLIGLLWGSSGQPCYCHCKRPHLKRPFNSSCNWKISLNFTGQHKRGTWTSVSRWVKLLKRYCLIFLCPLTSSPYFYSNKCRYWIDSSLCVFECRLIPIFSSPSPRSCGQHTWGEGRACPPSSYTHQRRARPSLGPTEAWACDPSSLGACGKRADRRDAEESRATSGTQASFSQQGSQPPRRKV